MFTHEHEVGTVESELHSSRLCREGMCSSFLFYITLSKPVQSHLVSFFAYAKAYTALKNMPKPLFSTLLSVLPGMQISE